MVSITTLPQNLHYRRSIQEWVTVSVEPPPLFAMYSCCGESLGIVRSSTSRFRISSVVAIVNDGFKVRPTRGSTVLRRRSPLELGVRSASRCLTRRVIRVTAERLSDWSQGTVAASHPGLAGWGCVYNAQTNSRLSAPQLRVSSAAMRDWLLLQLTQTWHL